MIINRKVSITLLICFIGYLISDTFFNDVILHLIGGLFGTVSNQIGLGNGFYFIWFVVLLGFVVLFYKIQVKLLKVALIISLWLLLYLIDALLYEIMPDITSKLLRYSHIGLSVLLKSLALGWIHYYGNKE